MTLNTTTAITLINNAHTAHSPKRRMPTEGATIIRVTTNIGNPMIAAIPAIAHEIFRVLYYGSLLPNTYHQKVEGIDGLFRAGLGYLWRFLRHYGLFVLVGVWGGFRLRDRRYFLLAVGFAVHVAAVVRVGGDLFPYSRFLAPWVPVILATSLAIPARLGTDSR